MTTPERVPHLGWLAGIYRDYWDIWGQQHFITPGAERVFLNAMGFDLSSIEAVEAAIDRLSYREWRAVSAPVIVVDEGGVDKGGAVAVTITLSASTDWAALN